MLVKYNIEIYKLKVKVVKLRYDINELKKKNQNLRKIISFRLDVSR
jgi:predicted  nucleic acid-binding Zn-ribbon protein